MLLGCCIHIIPFSGFMLFFQKVECLLSKIDQVPSRSVLDALQPCMKALTGSELLRHANTDVKVSIASCISEITRIMAPDTPFSDEEMKVI